MKKTTKKRAVKTSTKTGVKEKKTLKLRKSQRRILELLSKSKYGMTREELAKKGELNLPWMSYWLGSLNADTRMDRDASHFPSLLTLKLIKYHEEDVNNRDVQVWSLTALGKRAVGKRTINVAA